jgi:hypothetical protein
MNIVTRLISTRLAALRVVVEITVLTRVDLMLLDLVLYFIVFLEVSLIPQIAATASLTYVVFVSMLLCSIDSFFFWGRLRHPSDSILNKILIMEQHGAASSRYLSPSF